MRFGYAGRVYGFEYFKDYIIGQKIEVVGHCKQQLFYNEETGYGIYLFGMDAVNGKTFKVTGNFTDELVDGQTYNIVGEIDEYNYQKQIKAKDIYPCIPRKKDGIVSYLKLLKGLDFRAEDIYANFKEDSINILINDPMLVATTIKGIGKKSVLEWQEKLISMKELEDVYIGLLELGIKVKSANKLIEVYGRKALEEVRKNPYSLMKDISGYSFNKCDKLALDIMGYKPNNKNRIKAGAIYALENYQNFGHCFSPKTLLAPMIKELLNVTLSYKEMCNIYYNSKFESEVNYKKNGIDYKINIAELKKNINQYNSEKYNSEKLRHLYILFELNTYEVEKVITDMVKDNYLIESEGNLYLREVYEAEINVAEKIISLTKYRERYKREKVEEILDEIISEKGYNLELLQREACIMFNQYERGIFILGGGAGTGKTFTLNLILEVQQRLMDTYSGKKDKVTILAPTGKASKVASKSTGRPCSTIHRCLSMGGDLKSATTVICDETSMVDLLLADMFFKNIGDYTKVILIGDTGQIPSIGAGNVLNDLNESKLIKSVFLKVPKRQLGLSSLTQNANRVLENKMIKNGGSLKDFFIMERNSIASLRETVLESVRRILKFPGYTLDDVQVLIPQKTGSLGVNMLNYLLQQEFNKTTCKTKILKRTFDAKLDEKSKSQEFKLYIKKDDRVMHIKNDHRRYLYEKVGDRYNKVEDQLGIYNGETGIVEDIILTKGIIRVIVKYDDYYVFYDEGVEELELAYATTIHKSQGSSYKATVILITKMHSMWSNNLLYTALTRAREFIAVVGELETINNAIHNHAVVERFTTLNKRLFEAKRVA